MNFTRKTRGDAFFVQITNTLALGRANAVNRSTRRKGVCLTIKALDRI
jgi:hypothetical protein